MFVDVTATDHCGSIKNYNQESDWSAAAAKPNKPVNEAYVTSCQRLLPSPPKRTILVSDRGPLQSRNCLEGGRRLVLLKRNGALWKRGVEWKRKTPAVVE